MKEELSNYTFWRRREKRVSKTPIASIHSLFVYCWEEWETITSTTVSIRRKAVSPYVLISVTII